MAAVAVEVAVIGGGPAGLSAALNLVRARRSVLVIDSNGPRNAATLKARGFLTRDGISPLEPRKLGRAEVEAYDNGEVAFAVVSSVDLADDGFRIHAKGVRVSADLEVLAESVVIATGLTETLPAVPGIRAFYGTQLHSSVECDGFEKADAPLAFIGETNDLAERALLLTQWSSDLIVFTNGVGAVTADEEHTLGRLGVRVERREIADLTGGAGVMSGVRLSDGTEIARSGGFVRPRWAPSLAFAADSNSTLTTRAFCSPTRTAEPRCPAFTPRASPPRRGRSNSSSPPAPGPSSRPRSTVTSSA
ncbi:MAG: NAD(P)/FAD-dependent oxidoreductase [Leifsonia sp.]